MGFVTDFIWRSPLGLRINAQVTADVQMTEDWVRIRGDQLKPRNGAYDIRITAELWETHFFDLVSLLVVDHPEGTDVFVDERFAVPPPRPGVIATSPVQDFASVRDDQGRDVLETVRARDDRHLDFAGRGRYQGVTREHYIELELPAAAPEAVRCGSSRKAGYTPRTARSTWRWVKAITRRRPACRSTWPTRKESSSRREPGLDFRPARTRRS